MNVCVSGKGDLFGSDLDYEDPVIKSSCDVKSLTYCDLQCIQLNGLKEALLMYPEFAKRCATDLLHDLTYNLRDGFVDPDDLDDVITPAITLPSIVEEDTDDEDDDDSDANDDDDDDDVESRLQQQQVASNCDDDAASAASDASDELTTQSHNRTVAFSSMVSRSSTLPTLANTTRPAPTHSLAASAPIANSDSRSDRLNT